MENWEIARSLAEIAQLLDFQGAGPYKAAAYRKAAAAVALWPEPLADLHQTDLHPADRLTRIPGIGAAIAAQITQLLRTGAAPLLVELQAAVPPGLLNLVRLPGVGPRTALLLHQRLGISSLADLSVAIAAGHLRDLPGFGPRREAELAAAVTTRLQPDTLRSLPELLPVVGQLEQRLAADPAVQRTAVSGALRRGVDQVDGFDVVISTSDATAVLERLARRPDLPGPVAAVVTGRWPGRQPPPWLHHWPSAGSADPDGTEHPLHRDYPDGGGAGWGWTQVALTDGGEGRILAVPPPAFAVALWLTTGPPDHVAAVLAHAAAGSWRLTGTGWERRTDTVTPGSGPVPATGLQVERRPAADEADLFAAIGLAWVPPELRAGAADVNLAARNAVPELVAPEHLLGDLHTHTDWSDGRANIADMAAAAAGLGYRYLGVTDHSPLLRVANGLTPERLSRQQAALRAHDGPPVLWRGSEVDILKDGALDWPDPVLADLDLVVAAIHSHMRLPRDEMTRRLLAAIDNPHVDIIGHPMGRRLGRREPYDADWDLVLERAARTGTALEISASPGRLDLNGEMARRARAAGVLLCINTDAHSPDELRHVRLGVIQARRAGLGPGDILNTRDVGQVREWLQRPKSAP